MRPSRHLEIGAKHYLTSLLTESSHSKRLELVGLAKEERKTLSKMIDSRCENGCAYRLEFKFLVHNIDALSDPSLNLVSILESYVTDSVTPKLRLISPSIFPRSIWTVYDFFWNLADANLQRFVEEGPIHLMDFPRREFIALLDRLMVVCLNGNSQRNLDNWTCNVTDVASIIASTNWPSLSTLFFASSTKSIVFWSIDRDGKRSVSSDGDLCLFRYFSGPNKLLLKRNLLNLLKMEAEYLNFEEQVTDYPSTKENYVAIFREMVVVFISEIGALVKEKLQRHAATKRASDSFRQIFRRISQVREDRFLPTLAPISCSQELIVSASERISLSNLWDNHVVNGAFSTVQGLPSWFSSWASLVAFHTNLYRHTESMDQAQIQEILGLCKVEFNRLFLDQRIMIKFDRGVFWRNVGSFYPIGEDDPELTNRPRRNDLGLETRLQTNVQSAATRVVGTLNNATQGRDQRLRVNLNVLNSMDPSRFSYWQNIYMSDLTKISASLAKYLGFQIGRSPFGALSEDSPPYVKWIILTAFVMAELQPLLGDNGNISNRTSPFNNRQDYRVCLMCVFIFLFEGLPNPQGVREKRNWKKYFGNNKINLRS